MKNKNLYIAYYYNENDEQDAELYIGEIGTENEFREYWKKVNVGEAPKDIIGVYVVDKEWGIDGKEHKIKVIN